MSGLSDLSSINGEMMHKNASVARLNQKDAKVNQNNKITFHYRIRSDPTTLWVYVRRSLHLTRSGTLSISVLIFSNCQSERNDACHRDDGPDGSSEADALALDQDAHGQGPDGASGDERHVHRHI